MFVGVSMQLQAVFKYFLSHTVGRLPLKKKMLGQRIYRCEKLEVKSGCGKIVVGVVK